MICNWKLQEEEKGFKYITTCNYLANRHNDETEYYNFCPYCGNKIKIEKEI